jgi:hypothetical protein
MQNVQLRQTRELRDARAASKTHYLDTRTYRLRFGPMDTMPGVNRWPSNEGARG